MMTFKDIEETLSTFSGRDNYTIGKWIDEFEDVSILMNWNEVEKLIYGKRLLKDDALLLVRSEKNITSWDILKKKLKYEFGKSINSAALHKALKDRNASLVTNSAISPKTATNNVTAPTIFKHQNAPTIFKHQNIDREQKEENVDVLIKTFGVLVANIDDELDIGKPEYEQTIKQMINTYSPRKPKEMKIRTKIILEDEVPIHQQPRRLSLHEMKEVDKKCQFLKDNVTYLGHEIENGTVRPSRKKIEAVADFPEPTTLKKVQSFLDGFGGVLLQKDTEDGELHPVYYWSKKTNDAQRKYHSYELEVLAVVEALKKFRVYLLGIKFKILTDCSAFAVTMTKKDLCTRVARWALLLEEFDYIIEHRPESRVARWALLLEEFDYIIEHRPESRMKHCDALSRNPIALIVRNEFLEKVKVAFLEKVKVAQKEDEITLKAVIEKEYANLFMEEIWLLSGVYSSGAYQNFCRSF
ncbi:RNase H-like domain found in reverse transcriptase [Popillia japonica]|uniref:RNase H-like domain found in reverse transcriptase n=1 Tax=Popillia japonica TaxID=7064 RepID=A0AAW1ICZ7_POPJA